MPDPLIDALEREHQEIDKNIDRFLANSEDRAPLLGAMTALRRHIYIEEEFLFRALPDPALAAPTFVMLREHAQMWRLLDSLEEEIHTNGGDLAAATQLCRQLVVQLQHHNRKEELIIYAAATTIAPETRDRIDQLSRTTREAPVGWVCIKARG